MGESHIGDDDDDAEEMSFFFVCRAESPLNTTNCFVQKGERKETEPSVCCVLLALNQEKKIIQQ